MKKFEKIDLGLKEAYEELFMNDEERIINRSPRVLDIEISQIDDFEYHPFKVKDDEDMEKLMESIATYGVLTPVIIRERETDMKWFPATEENTPVKDWVWKQYLLW